MRKLVSAALGPVTVFLCVLPAAIASAEPTLTLKEECAVSNGVVASVSGFPPNTGFFGSLESPDGSVVSANLTTDASGSLTIGGFSSLVPGTWTATVVWSGGTLVKSLNVSCPSVPGRMVGKGTISNGGQTASYVYILGCNLLNPAPPFEVRFGTQRFRLTSLTAVICRDNPLLVPSPAAGFDTNAGTGTGTLATGLPATVQWSFLDGGIGGVSDSAHITIRDAFGAILFTGTASPPRSFPGSSQPTGNNTAQLPP